jgi:hypothetical protein
VAKLPVLLRGASDCRQKKRAPRGLPAGLKLRKGSLANSRGDASLIRICSGNAGQAVPARRLFFQIVYECLPDRAHEPHHHAIHLRGSIRESAAGPRPDHIADDSRQQSAPSQVAFWATTQRSMKSFLSCAKDNVTAISKKGSAREATLPDGRR